MSQEKLDWPLLALKMEGGHKPRNVGRPLDTGEGKEVHSSLETAERNATLMIP